MLKASPLFGVGKGMYGDFSEHGLVAHNSFVHCWAELGLFGYFFWLGMVIASAKDGWALSKAQPVGEDDAAELSRLGRAGFAGLAGFMAAAMFLSRTYVAPLYILFALLAALRQIYEANCGPLQAAFQPRDWKLVLAAELVSIPALYVAVRALG